MTYDKHHTVLQGDSVRRDLEMHSHLKDEVGGAGGGGGGKILSIVMVSSPIYKL